MNISEILTICIGYLFISTSLNKLSDIPSHSSLIFAYKIIPAKYTKVSAWIDGIIELCIGASLILGIFVRISLLSALMLILIYTIAISVNLYRGNTSIECGCGGLVGNQKLSNKLIFRNILFMLLFLSLILVGQIEIPYNITYFIVNGILILISIKIMTIIEYTEFYKQTKSLT